MAKTPATVPDQTAVRVALWRALHLRTDPLPHVLEDEIGLKLAKPSEDWVSRPDMDPERSKRFRASILARARFVEDLVLEQVGHGLRQYVILGAGLDSFAQRKPQSASELKIFEIDKPDTQAWKKKRLKEEGFSSNPIFVPVDFEAGDSWLKKLSIAGYDSSRPSLVASTGVSMYLTFEAIATTLRQIATLAPGTMLAMTFMQPVHLIEKDMQAVQEIIIQRAKESGTPFLTFFSPQEIATLALECGFKETRHVSAASLNQKYFSGRKDGLRTSNGEEMIVATV